MSKMYAGIAGIDKIQERHCEDEKSVGNRGTIDLKLFLAYNYAFHI